MDLKSSQGDQVKLQEDQETVKQDQTDLKNHVLQRLDALDEKTAWCLSNGQKRAHPLDDRMRKIEQQEEQQNVTLTWIKDFLRVRLQELSLSDFSQQQRRTCLSFFYHFIYPGNAIWQKCQFSLKPSIIS